MKYILIASLILSMALADHVLPENGDIKPGLYKKIFRHHFNQALCDVLAAKFAAAATGTEEDTDNYH